MMQDFRLTFRENGGSGARLLLHERSNQRHFRMGAGATLISFLRKFGAGVRNHSLTVVSSEKWLLQARDIKKAPKIALRRLFQPEG
jgi:hypothetical protein